MLDLSHLELDETVRDRGLELQPPVGNVANEHHTTVDQAFTRIRTHARNRNVSIRSVAEAIVHLGLKI